MAAVKVPHNLGRVPVGFVVIAAEPHAGAVEPPQVWPVDKDKWTKAYILVDGNISGAYALLIF